ncbi:hypothetical protein GUJ93_ZPchr0007g6231 [Zizania palustris]|uniref:Uncharacterized protein n=1 Tax=Zizania palustris TaxID=103762 RepID=A0A8J5TK32_ZIZPA|nr:hypothetical protein GUJ93_ZPchr0007g6231 [Zizania palustris]
MAEGAKVQLGLAGGIVSLSSSPLRFSLRIRRRRDDNLLHGKLVGREGCIVRKGLHVGHLALLICDLLDEDGAEPLPILSLRLCLSLHLATVGKPVVSWGKLGSMEAT